MTSEELLAFIWQKDENKIHLKTRSMLGIDYYAIARFLQNYERILEIDEEHSQWIKNLIHLTQFPGFRKLSFYRGADIPGHPDSYTCPSCISDNLETVFSKNIAFPICVLHRTQMYLTSKDDLTKAQITGQEYELFFAMYKAISQIQNADPSNQIRAENYLKRFYRFYQSNRFKSSYHEDSYYKYLLYVSVKALKFAGFRS